MKKLGLLLLAVGLYVIPAQAATESEMQTLFARSEATLSSFTAICEKAPTENQDATVTLLMKQCAIDVRAAHADLRKNKERHERGDLTGDSQRAWLQSHREAFYRIAADFNRLASRMTDSAQPLSSYIDPLHPRKQLADVSCSDVLGAATAVCSLFLIAPVAGEVLAAACEAAAIAGWINCISNKTALGPGAS